MACTGTQLGVPLHVSRLDLLLGMLVFLGVFALLLLDACMHHILLLELVVEVGRHGFGTDLGKGLDVEAVELRTPIVDALLRDHDFFPGVELSLFAHFRLTTDRG